MVTINLGDVPTLLAYTTSTLVAIVSCVLLAKRSYKIALGVAVAGGVFSFIAMFVLSNPYLMFAYLAIFLLFYLLAWAKVLWQIIEKYL